LILSNVKHDPLILSNVKHDPLILSLILLSECGERGDSAMTDEVRRYLEKADHALQVVSTTASAWAWSNMTGRVEAS
jgi:hypothetical protein